MTYQMWKALQFTREDHGGATLSRHLLTFIRPPFINRGEREVDKGERRYGLAVGEVL